MSKQHSSKTKLRAVLSYIKGVKLEDICNEYGIVRSTFYKWRDQFLSNGEKAFEINHLSKAEQKLRRENSRLKQIVAEQSLELKKNDDELI